MTEKKKQRVRACFLIVEPDLEKRSYLSGLLRRLGYDNVEQAPDGATAFNILKRRPVDCIIAAWEMPQMNGLSLLKVVCADDELYTIPFFITTRTVDRETVMMAGKHGVTSILVEPVKLNMLQEKIEAALGAHPDAEAEKTEDLFQKAQKLLADGKYDEALKIYKEILDIHEDAEVYYNIGYIKTAQKKFDEAIVAFRKAVMIDNVHARAFKMMGKVYSESGEPQEAEKYFKKAGEIFLERQMDEEAEESFKEVLKLNPSTVTVYNHLGIIYRRQHKPKKAVKLYKMAIEVDGEDENIYYNLGRALMEDKEINEAKEIFQKALKLNPDFAEAKKMLAAIEVGI